MSMKERCLVGCRMAMLSSCTMGTLTAADNKRDLEKIGGRPVACHGLAVLLALWAAIIAASPLGAQYIMRTANLTELAQRADIIVQGRVVEVRYEGLPGYPNIPTVQVALQVEKILRGSADQRFTFREYLPGPAGLARMKKGDYVVGQRLLLFLPNPSQYGLSSPLGREQGRFQIKRDQRGNEVVANGFGNADLFRNVTEAARKAGATLSARQLRVTSHQRGPVPLDDFVSLVKDLGSLPRTE
jgi:hypothetical protein